MNQTSGWVINDSGSLGSAFLGSSTLETQDPVAENMPSWIPRINPTTGLNYHVLIILQASYTYNC